MTVEALETPAPIGDECHATGEEVAAFLKEATGELSEIAALLRLHRDRRARKSRPDTR